MHSKQNGMSQCKLTSFNNKEVYLKLETKMFILEISSEKGRQIKASSICSKADNF